MMTPLISVIVPVYKVEDYVERCLNSISKQTYSNIEILVVDDGSPDNSGVICDRCAEKDSRIKVLHVSNGGVSNARRLGFESSKGEYIVFVDSDDWLPENSIETLYSNMTDEVDIVMGAITRVDAGREFIICQQKDFIPDLTVGLLNAHFFPSCWGKLFRRKLFKTDSFPNLKYSEDWILFIEISMRSGAAKVLKESTYNYLKRETSAVTTFIEDVDLKYIIILMTKAKDILESYSQYDKYKYDYFAFALFFLSKVHRMGTPVDRKNPTVKALLKDINLFKLKTKESKLKYLIIKYPLFHQLRRVQKRLKATLNKE